MGPHLATLPVVVLLLVLAAVVAVVTHRAGVPYTVALVVVGVLLGALRLVSATALDPTLVLSVLLPPLLFEAAFVLRWQQLAGVATSIISLATLGVAVSAVITAAVLLIVARVDLAVALLFGILVAATDPVAVVAFFRHAKVSPALRALVEGESLLNDGTATVLAAVAGGFLVGGAVAPAGVLMEFLRVAMGGLLVGVLVGLAATLVAHGTSDYLVEATLSVGAAYGSYLIGEQVHASGILAVVGAGSVFGNFGRRFGLSEDTEAAIDLLWHFFAFVANSLVFLLLGSAVVPGDLVPLWPLIALGVVAALLGRAAVAYGLGAALGRLTGAPVPAWRHVLFWGGLRGALPVVVAIALTAELRLSHQLIDLVLGVVVVTLLVQGLTLRPVFEHIPGLGRANVD